MVLASGCGLVAESPDPTESSQRAVTKTQYLNEIKRIRQELGKRFSGQRPTGSVKTRVTAELRQVKEGSEEFSKRLADLEPPLEARNAHALWVKGLEELVAQTEPLIEAVETGSESAYNTALQELFRTAAIDLGDAQTLFYRLRYPLRTSPTLPPALRKFQASRAQRARILK